MHKNHKLLENEEDMTIKIEREALNCITHGAPTTLHHTQQTASSCLSSGPVSPEPLGSQVYEKRPDVSSSADVMEESSYPELVLSDDDSSVSSCSIDSTSSRRVSFRHDLVTEVRLRPRTPQRDIRKLYYSYDETQR